MAIHEKIYVISNGDHEFYVPTKKEATDVCNKLNHCFPPPWEKYEIIEHPLYGKLKEKTLRCFSMYFNYDPVSDTITPLTNGKEGYMEFFEDPKESHKTLIQENADGTWQVCVRILAQKILRAADIREQAISKAREDIELYKRGEKLR